MKPPPRKTEDEMTMKELREYRKLQEAEAEADRIEAEERANFLECTTRIQNSLIAEAERDIRICKSQIDDMKEDYHRYDDTHDFDDILTQHYQNLREAETRLIAIRNYPFNAPITTDTSNRNHDWDRELYHEATNQYEDLREDNTYGNNQTDGW